MPAKAAASDATRSVRSRRGQTATSQAPQVTMAAPAVTKQSSRRAASDASPASGQPAAHPVTSPNPSRARSAASTAAEPPANRPMRAKTSPARFEAEAAPSPRVARAAAEAAAGLQKLAGSGDAAPRTPDNGPRAATALPTTVAPPGTAQAPREESKEESSTQVRVPAPPRVAAQCKEVCTHCMGTGMRLLMSGHSPLLPHSSLSSPDPPSHRGRTSVGLPLSQASIVREKEMDGQRVMLVRFSDGVKKWVSYSDVEIQLKKEY